MSSMSAALAPQAFLALLFLVGVAAALPPEQDAAVELAKRTLAEKLQKPAEGLELVSVEAATWAGPELSCRSAPASEPVSEVTGYLVRLALQGAAFDVKVSDSNAIVCGFTPVQRPQAQRGPVEADVSGLAERARADLAKRLSVAPEKIEILEAISVVWRDASAGCPKKGMQYLQVLTPGVRIRLGLTGKTYQYHGTQRSAPFLCQHPSDVEPLLPEDK